MLLRDHFHKPARGRWRWKSVHSTWTTKVMEGLNNKVLPPSYYAVPTVQLGNEAQVDITAVQDDEEAEELQAGNGAVAIAVWSPPKPPLVVSADLADLDVLEVEVRNEDEGYRLVAAIELISPANKDRPAHRRAFAAKCAGYLQQDVSVIIVDIVTERHDNLHAELMDMLELGEEPRAAVSSDLYAVAYRAVGRERSKPSLEMWPAALQLGDVLPVLPLWITPKRAVPLDLNASYSATCEALRMT